MIRMTMMPRIPIRLLGMAVPPESVLLFLWAARIP
jgi:hypothetical protein